LNKAERVGDGLEKALFRLGKIQRQIGYEWTQLRQASREPEAFGNKKLTRLNTSLIISSYLALLDTDMYIDEDGSQTAQQRRLLISFVCEVKWVYRSKSMLFTTNG
jgi:hypothetical protein